MPCTAPLMVGNPALSVMTFACTGVLGLGLGDVGGDVGLESQSAWGRNRATSSTRAVTWTRRLAHRACSSPRTVMPSRKNRPVDDVPLSASSRPEPPGSLGPLLGC